MTHTRWTFLSIFPLAVLLSTTPASASWHGLIGAGPDIGVGDVADGTKTPGFNGRVMLQLAPEDAMTGLRLDASYTQFWAEGNVGNEDLKTFALIANAVFTFSPGSNVRPYCTLGGGYSTYVGTGDNSRVNEETTHFTFGLGAGAQFGWGVIEARADLLDTISGGGLHVPIFAAIRF